MPPRNVDIAASTDEDDLLKSEVEAVVTPETQQQKHVPLQIVWRNVVSMIVVHLGAIFGFLIIPWTHPLTWLWGK